MPSRAELLKISDSTLVIIALAVSLCAAPRSIAAQEADERKARAEFFDRAEDEEDLNRELWEYVKGTPYAGVLSYVARAQARARETRVAEAVLPSGWKIAPAGRQVELGRLPYEAVVFAGRLVVLNTGFYSREPQEVSIVEPASGRVEKTLRISSLFPSAVVGPGGDLYLSGGFDSKVLRVDRQFNVAREYAVAGYAAGLAAIDERRLAVLYLAAKDEKGAYIEGRLAVLDTQTGKVERETDAGYFPYSVRQMNGKLYVAVLGENHLRVFDAQLKELGEIPVGRRPQEMCTDGARLYVVNTDSDELTLIDTARDRVVATLRTNRFGTPFGTAPTSCAVSGGRVYVTLAGMNAVAVYDQRTRRQVGLVPTGWYPTKVTVEGQRLLILNAKGVRVRRPNPRGPQPIEGGGGPQYVLTLSRGSLSIVPLSEVNARGRAALWTRQVLAGAPTFDARRGLKLPVKHVFYVIKENRSYDQILGDLGRGDGDPTLTLFGRDISPNHHALAEQFVTLDNFYADGDISVLGHSFTTSGYASPFLEWLASAAYSGRYRGYPFGMVPSVTSPTYLWDALDEAGVSYKIYGENYYLYTRAYSILLDELGDSYPTRKFYARMMRLASDADRGRIFHDFAKPYAGRADTVEEAERLLREEKFAAAFSNFLVGDETLALALGNRPLRLRFAEYLTRYSFDFKSWDLNHSDLERFAAWRADFDRQLKTNSVPRFNYLWLPNNHTNGADTRIRTPQQFVAQNDAALGLLVETISRSPIWPDSLILVEEDDAQNGPDHVDATRIVALAAGPRVRRGAVVSDRYDQLSALRTVGLLLGFRPLNLNDRMAVPLFSIFNARPDLTPYTAPEPVALSAADRARYEELRRAR